MGVSAGVLLSTFNPPVRLGPSWLEFCPCVSPWVRSVSPLDRLREVSLDTRTLKLRLKRWRLCEAVLLGWEGWRNRGLMKHGLINLNVRWGAEGGGGAVRKARRRLRAPELWKCHGRSQRVELRFRKKLYFLGILEHLCHVPVSI